MKRYKIRYKKIAVCLFLLAGLIGLAVYLISFCISRLYTPSAPAESPEAGPSYILFIGTHTMQTSRADSLLLFSYNKARQEGYAISLPGNTKISREGEKLLLLKDAYQEGNAEKTVSAVENLLHIRIGQYAVIDSAAFASAVDRFGGVDLYVEENMRHEDENGATDILLRQGFQTLKNTDAYGYMRFIDQDSGELGRIQREERLLKALFEQSQKNLALFNWGLVRYGWQSPDTDLSQAQAASIAYELTKLPKEQMHFMILPGEIKTEGHVQIWDINPIEIQKVVGLTISQ